MAVTRHITLNLIKAVDKSKACIKKTGGSKLAGQWPPDVSSLWE
jgi:hypothetical protein